MVGHHGIGTDVDREGIGQLSQALSNPALAVFVVLAGKGVFATEEGAADTSEYRMAVGGVTSGQMSWFLARVMFPP